MENQQKSPVRIIKGVYFYLVSFVALMMVVFSAANMIDIGLKTWVFKEADNMYYYDPMCPTISSDLKAAPESSLPDCERQKEESRKQQEKMRVAERQKSLVRDISMIAVGIPLFIIHWGIARRRDENL